MGAGPNDTRSAVDSRAGEATPTPEPQLYLVLDCERLTTPPLRVALGELDAVTLGRGPARELARARDGGRRSLDLRLDDAFMSSRHARLGTVLDCWYVEDAGSKNGTLVNGKRVERRVLVDGDWIELGRTFFLYRDAELAADDAPWAGPPALRTVIPGLARIFSELAVIAPGSPPVALRGEVGTGKEVTARALHDLSRRTGPFVGLNCGALPPTLLESELFGHRKGAFTGAIADHVGLVRSADGGTLFLDEIGELTPAAQVALLRVLQEREVVPVGGTRPIAVDIRLVTATHRDLPAMVEAGTFRADLFSRLSGLTVTLPPLRERLADFGLLVAALLARAPTPTTSMSPNAARRLLAHAWPGNIRELERCLETATLLARGGAIASEHLLALRDAPETAAPEPVAPEPAPDVDALTALLREHRGNVSAVARRLGKAPVQVRRWLKRHGLVADDFRGDDG